jgi:hypothetical protein
LFKYSISFAEGEVRQAAGPIAQLSPHRPVHVQEQLPGFFS